jgi:hypothetical protein
MFWLIGDAVQEYERRPALGLTRRR